MTLCSVHFQLSSAQFRKATLLIFLCDIDQVMLTGTSSFLFKKSSSEKAQHVYLIQLYLVLFFLQTRKLTCLIEPLLFNKNKNVDQLIYQQLADVNLTSAHFFKPLSSFPGSNIFLLHSEQYSERIVSNDLLLRFFSVIKC